MGASGRRIIQAMIDGVRQPNKLAELAGKQIKATPRELYDALHGRLTDHHRFLLALHLKQWDRIDETIRKVDIEIDRRIGWMEAKAGSDRTPFRTLIELLTTMPGVSGAAPAILSEIGPDMSRLPRAGHLVAWAGLCPGQNESAGKRKVFALRKGAPLAQEHARTMRLGRQAREGQYYRAQFLRLQARRGPQKAICAVAASILTAILKDGTEHDNLGGAYFDRRPVEVKASRLVAHLKSSASPSNSSQSRRLPDAIPQTVSS